MMIRPQFIATISYLLCVFALTASAMEPRSADVSVTPDHVYADGIQEAAIVATQILDVDGIPVPDGTVVSIIASRGTIEGGTANPVAGYRDFVIGDNTLVATYRSEDLALAPNQTTTAGISLYSLRDDGVPYRLVETALVTLVGKSSAILSLTPDHVYADGIQTASIVITDILDADGNPVPDGEVCALHASRGTIEGGSPNPAGGGYQDFVIENNSIVATYRSPDLALSPNQTTSDSVSLHPLRPDGIPLGATGGTLVTLIGKGDAVVTLTPNRVYADGIQTASVVITDILNADGNPVPDGEVCALRASRGTIEGGSPNPVGNGYRDFVIENNSIVATYRSLDLALFPNQTSSDFVSLHPLRPDGIPLGSAGGAIVTLVGKSDAVVTVTPDHVYADGIQTASIVITDILDVDGNPVPDGEVCALRASRGTIEGGLPNPAGNGYQDFVIENNSIVATYRSADFALFPNQSSNAFVSLHALRPDGFPLGSVGGAVVSLIGKSSATVTPAPDQVFADGVQTSLITITDILDADGNPVPDGEICAIGASFGSIEGGTPSPAAGFRDFVIQDNMILATYRAPNLNLFPGQMVFETIALRSIRPDGFPFATTATGRITLTGIADVDNDGVPDPEDNCPADFNPLQEDLDADGQGDVCDPDDDSDGVPDIQDNCPIDPNPDQQDFDLDGMGNACDDVFGGDGIIADLEFLILELRDLIVAVNPPGGNGMIAKLTANGGVLSKAAGAVVDFGNETIDVSTYLEELDRALAMLDAFDLQLAAKRENGQIPVVEGDEMQYLSGQVRGLLESLKSAVGG